MRSKSTFPQTILINVSAAIFCLYRKPLLAIGQTSPEPVLISFSDGDISQVLSSPVLYLQFPLAPLDIPRKNFEYLLSYSYS